QVKKALKMATSSTDTLDVIVFKSPCQLIRRKKLAPPKVENCRACGLCLKLGCSAINKGEDGAIFIDTSLCIGCGQCEQICAFGAIKQ
ncbi:MAG: 4Fe-4S binding protein, partial [Coriobacteriales bacterium]|nr:4Fe-4S binding protein [Coriobacteriales bacterium]